VVIMMGGNLCYKEKRFDCVDHDGRYFKLLGERVCFS
jgi:hypothetical protein